MTLRCLCFAPLGGCHAFVCPFPMHDRYPEVMTRWHAERAQKRDELRKQIGPPDERAQVLLAAIAEIPR